MAIAARESLHGKVSSDLGDRILFIEYSLSPELRIDNLNCCSEGMMEAPAFAHLPSPPVIQYSALSQSLWSAQIWDQKQLKYGYVPGLVMIPDFVTESEASQLMEFLDSKPWEHHKYRSVQHYGFRFEYVSTVRHVSDEPFKGTMCY
jgi:hypothetical protein